MSHKRENSQLEAIYPSISSKRIHSFNSYLTDKSYYSTTNLQGIRRLIKFGSKIFGPRKREYEVESHIGLVEYSGAWNSDDSNDELLVQPPPIEYSKRRKYSLRYTKNTSPYEKGIKPETDIKGLLSQDDVNNRRIIVVSGLPKNTSLNSFLYRVCGGPLERVVYHGNRLHNTIELYFMFPRDAIKFWEYGLTGLFLHNGKHVKMEWANETNTDNINLIHPPMERPLRFHIEAGARRTLAFVQEILHNNDAGSDNYCKEFNIKGVLLDFAAIGNIVEFCPIVSKLLAFAIHFDDVRGAILVKQQCETLGTKLSDKYKDWKVSFVRDISEKPCLAV